MRILAGAKEMRVFEETEINYTTFWQKIRLLFIKGYTFRDIVSGHPDGRIYESTMKRMDGKIFVTKARFVK